MVVELLQLISEYLSMYDQLKLRKLNYEIYNYIKIFKIINISAKSKDKINQQILDLAVFDQLQELDIRLKLYYYLVYHELNLSKFSHTLLKLDCRGNKYINQYSIQNLQNLKVLSISTDCLINNIGHLQYLIELNIEKKYIESIGNIYNDNKINNLIQNVKKLKILRINNNQIINNVNFLSDSLVELECENTKIDQNGIKDLKYIQKLNIKNNIHITDINHLASTLTHLNCSGTCGVNQEGIEKLNNIKEITLCGNNKINSLNHLSGTLIKIDCKCSKKCTDKIINKLERYKKQQLEKIIRSTKVEQDKLIRLEKVQQDKLNRDIKKEKDKLDRQEKIQQDKLDRQEKIQQNKLDRKNKKEEEKQIRKLKIEQDKIIRQEKMQLNKLNKKN